MTQGCSGARDPSSAIKQGPFLLLPRLAGQPQSHTPGGNSSLCLATAASFTLTGTQPLTTFWETDLPGSFHSPFQGLRAVKRVSLGSNLNTSCSSFTPMGSRAQGRRLLGTRAAQSEKQCRKMCCTSNPLHSLSNHHSPAPYPLEPGRPRVNTKMP